MGSKQRLNLPGQQESLRAREGLPRTASCPAAHGGLFLKWGHWPHAHRATVPVGTTVPERQPRAAPQPSDRHQGSGVCVTRVLFLTCIMKWSLDECMEHRCSDETNCLICACFLLYAYMYMQSYLNPKQDTACGDWKARHSDLSVLGLPIS